MTLPIVYSLETSDFYLITETENAYSSVFTSQRYIYKINGYYWTAVYNNSVVYIWSSSDGITWENQGSISSTANTPASNTRYAVGWYKDTMYADIGIPNSCYYRSFTLNSDGTVTADQATNDIIATNGNCDGIMGVAISSSEIPFTAGLDTQYTASINHPQVYRGSCYNCADPSWIFEDYTATPNTPAGDQYTQPYLIDLDDGDMYIIYSIIHSGRADSKDLWGTFFNNATLAFETPLQMVDDDLLNTHAYYTWAGVRNSSGNMHMVYIDLGSSIHHISATNSTSGLAWQEHNISIADNSAQRVVLTINNATDEMYMFYETGESIYYKNYSNGFWNPETLLITVDTTLYPMSVYPYVIDDEIVLTFSNGSGIPYSRQFVTLTVPSSDPCACPIPASDFRVLEGCVIDDCDIDGFTLFLECETEIKFTGNVYASTMVINPGCNRNMDGGVMVLSGGR